MRGIRERMRQVVVDSTVTFGRVRTISLRFMDGTRIVKKVTE